MDIDDRDDLQRRSARLSSYRAADRPAYRAPSREPYRTPTSGAYRPSPQAQHRSPADRGREMPLGVNERRRGTGSGRPSDDRGPYGDIPARGAAQRGPHRGNARDGASARSSRPAQGGPARNGRPEVHGAQSTRTPQSRRGPQPNRAPYGARSRTQGRPPQYMSGGSRRNAYPYVHSGRIFTRNRPADLLREPRVIIALVALLVIGLGTFGIVSNMQKREAEIIAQEQAAAEKKRLAAQVVHPSKLGMTALPASTPKSEWKQGTMPHLYQIDPVWSNKPYAGNTVRANACGPTSMAMVYACLTGRTDMDPAAMSAFADQNGFAPTGATEWAFMTQGANMLGINSVQIHPTRTDVENALSNGRPVICSMYPGDFTSVGHFIVLRSINERGMVEVFDPNSPFNSARLWGIQQLLQQTNACWSFWL